MNFNTSNKLIIFCENSQEVSDIKRDYNVVNPSEVLEKYLGDTNTILAHAVKLNDTEMLI